MILLNKPQGFTPLQAINEWKKQNTQYMNKKISYAGRLDPMAEGLLLLLEDEENKKRNLYEQLTKTYRTEVVLGISTDSYDALGKITKKTKRLQRIKISRIKELLKGFEGQQQQPYPPYSSKPVNGKPLFYWARKNQLDKIIIPSKEITIFEIKLVSIRYRKKDNLEKTIDKKINRVTGEFRQEEIKKEWENFFTTTEIKNFPVINLEIKASSGTYMRSIAHNLGKELQTQAFALKINRIALGNYQSKHALSLRRT